AARSEVFAAKETELRGHAAVKESLLAEAQALLPITDWRASRSALRGIQERWEQAGPVPRESRDQLEQGLRRVEGAGRAAAGARGRPGGGRGPRRGSGPPPRRSRGLRARSSSCGTRSRPWSRSSPRLRPVATPPASARLRRRWPPAAPGSRKPSAPWPNSP